MPAWEEQVAIPSPAQRFEGVTRAWLPYAAPGSERPCEAFGLAGPESVGAPAISTCA